MSLIYTHPRTGGELHQLGAKEIPYLIKDGSFDLIILAAKQFQPKTLKKANKQYQLADKVYVPMDDSSKLNHQELKETIKLAKFAANKAIKTILDGGKVISSCQAGWNRSGLISGLTIRKLTGADPVKIIRSIRRKRSIFALSNPLFVKVLKSY